MAFGRLVFRMAESDRRGTETAGTSGIRAAVPAEERPRAQPYWAALPISKVRLPSAYPSLVFNLAYFEPDNHLGGEARFVAGDGQDRCYEYGQPEYQRLERDLGWDMEDEEEEEEEART